MVLNESCLLLCGEFNCTLQSIDRKAQNHDTSRPFFREFINYFSVKNTYRTHNKDKVCNTYSNNSGIIQSRLDCIFCSGYLNTLSRKCYVQNVPEVPDHKIVVAKIQLGR